MSSQKYKTTVSAFVLGGLALLALGFIVLGGGRLFSNDMQYVLYFDGSVSGLSTGAPVVFRGVPMGSVTRINLVANTRDSNVTIPVYIRIDEQSFVRARGSAPISESVREEIVRRMVQRADYAWVHGRGRNAEIEELRGKRVALVGCGALGPPRRSRGRSPSAASSPVHPSRSR